MTTDISVVRSQVQRHKGIYNPLSTRAMKLNVHSLFSSGSGVDYKIRTGG